MVIGRDGAKYKQRAMCVCSAASNLPSRLAARRLQQFESETVERAVTAAASAVVSCKTRPNGIDRRTGGQTSAPV